MSPVPAMLEKDMDGNLQTWTALESSQNPFAMNGLVF